MERLKARDGVCQPPEFTDFCHHLAIHCEEALFSLIRMFAIALCMLSVRVTVGNLIFHGCFVYVCCLSVGFCSRSVFLCT